MRYPNTDKRMKLSYTVATPDVHDQAILAMRGELDNSFKLLSDAGYNGVELMVRDVNELVPGEITQLASDFQLEIAAVSSGQIAFEDDLTISSLSANTVTKTVARMKEIIDFAKSVGCSLVNVGTIRGKLPPSEPDRSAALEHAAAAFGEIAAYSQAKNVRIAVEPQSRYVVNWHNTLQETADWLIPYADKKPGILFDVYHTMLEESSVMASLIRWFPAIYHIQISDNTRNAPGTGNFNFVSFFRCLNALDYRGFVSVEMKQPANDQVIQKTAARLKNWLLEITEVYEAKA